MLTLKAGEQIEQVYIHNLLGQEVINITPNQLETQINLSNLQADVYLMKVIIDGNSKVFRVIKQ